MSVVPFQSLPVEAPGWSQAHIEGYDTSEEMIAALAPSLPVYCLYPHLLRRAAGRFLDGFPGRVLYAVKANPSPAVLRELHAAGLRSFDTASLGEVELVRNLFSDAECYFMAPSKLVGAAEAAYGRYGVRHFVADHDSEVERLLAVTGLDAQIHIRMKAFDPAALFELSSKFGAEWDEAAFLLARVASAGRRPGLAFNVGSQCGDPGAYRAAIAAAAEVAARAGGIKLATLDVGGGFPSPYPSQRMAPLADFFAAIRQGAAADLPQDCQLLCEPGRALVAEGQSIVTQVILVKDRQVFLNDGLYGSFREWELSGQTVTYPLGVVRPGECLSAETACYTAYGPTCDSLDVLPSPLALPADIRVGDWIEFGLAGAYSNASTSHFNGFEADRWVEIQDPTALPPGVGG